jgi:AcrR family transcriptional regulator
VLHAVDDLLVEVGYAAMTIKGIAERAGVGRETIYRWWSNKAEILLEACAVDIDEDIEVPEAGPAAERLVRYLGSVTAFLTESTAGAAYRALVGEAQHDPAVRELVQSAALLTGGALRLLDELRAELPAMPERNLAVTQLLGPVHFAVLTGSRSPSARQLAAHAHCLLRAWG